jgi:tellurite resistance protein
MSTKRPNVQRLRDYASNVRSQVSAADQQAIFHAAIEAGHLAATTDGSFDEQEKAALVKAIELLSEGSVIEWEIDSLVEASTNRAETLEERASGVAEKLRASGHAEAGLLVAAFVAQATSGIDKKEEKVLKSIAKAAGVSDKRTREILKTVGSDATVQ